MNDREAIQLLEKNERRIDELREKALSQKNI